MRAYAEQIERHGWRSLRDPDASSRRFWALAIGVMVEGFAMGRAAEADAQRNAARARRSGHHQGYGSALRLVGRR